ncbi:MAG: tyrosine--tRNA ligase [Flavobacteriaceae bacterium]|nr:tyrosine--tRNA ligase [Flavobacteriaceae bacterium]CAI8316621.1 MAG: Tyrosine--tRNA ligase [Flavobacteriaceae bacterium]|tara:strand:+ start:278 stop:1570 length:1293 start_codon:yes stop_codon:yes gene_type:complete
MKNFIDEIRWRGLIHDEMPGIEDHLSDSIRVSYTGFDPTSNSLHIGSLVPIILLAHFQRSGHKPIALIGGATGMIGDPSGKSAERNLLDEETLVNNQTAIKQQLSQFLNFDSKEKNSAVILNNFDWMNKFSFLEFTRDIGKHISVNYMMSKDSVKNRISSESSSGMSFTEFTYQLIQGYDFLHLHKNYNCTIQMGGSDQWGNITTGTELIRRIDSGKGYALTCPLITKSDGAKFGKSETGNIWLDPNKTSVYKFYQYWLNTSDDDAEKYIKIFTFLSKKEINNIVILHKNEPHKRLIQKSLAKEITTIVHSAKSFSQVELASTILYSKSFKKDIESIDENTFLDIFEGVPFVELPKNELVKGFDMISVLSSKTEFLKSNSDARRSLSENSISINKSKVKEDYLVENKDLINDKYVIINKGKRSTFIIKFT